LSLSESAKLLEGYDRPRPMIESNCLLLVRGTQLRPDIDFRDVALWGLKARKNSKSAVVLNEYFEKANHIPLAILGSPLPVAKNKPPSPSVHLVAAVV
jgi:hypothetical protein